MDFWKATAIRALRTFLQVIAGAWTAGQIITELKWKVILMAALSAAVYSVLTSIITGLPEVDEPIYEEDVDDVDAIDYEPGDEEVEEGDDDE